MLKSVERLLAETKWPGTEAQAIKTVWLWRCMLNENSQSAASDIRVNVIQKVMPETKPFFRNTRQFEKFLSKFGNGGTGQGRQGALLLRTSSMRTITKLNGTVETALNCYRGILLGLDILKEK